MAALSRAKAFVLLVVRARIPVAPPTGNLRDGRAGINMKL
jgi:hypothetical protein